MPEYRNNTEVAEEEEIEDLPQGLKENYRNLKAEFSEDNSLILLVTEQYQPEYEELSEERWQLGRLADEKKLRYVGSEGKIVLPAERQTIIQDLIAQGTYSVNPEEPIVLPVYDLHNLDREIDRESNIPDQRSVSIYFGAEAKNYFREKPYKEDFDEAVKTLYSEPPEEFLWYQKDEENEKSRLRRIREHAQRIEERYRLRMKKTGEDASITFSEDKPMEAISFQTDQKKTDKQRYEK